ncbi:O-acyltransferase [Nesidiocoris tenuis]|uniref:O-acyltransferase n=1 Tax=Nesidiocoris tenuis TaxID=355587 RepID=A0ABN7A8D3_9HEMI|nr:O-acyltransferase [Nesidiocoris tenuis]
MSSDNNNEGLRLRRTKSVSRAEDVVKEEQRVRRSQPDKPCHRPRDSLFSWSSGFTDFTGLVNWAVILLFMGGLRLLLENFIKYGIRIDPEQWLIVLTGSHEGPGHPSIYLFLYSGVHNGLCFMIEKGLAANIIPDNIGVIAHVVNICVMITIPMIAITLKSTGFSLMGASFVCFIYSVMFLKLWSYAQVNYWCRKAKNAPAKGHVRRQSMSSETEKIANGHENMRLVVYPDNVTVKDFIFFIWAPTLCYELNFPRTDRIRKRFLLKRLIEVVVLFQLIACLFQQWIIPSVKNSLIPFSNMDVMKATERLLKLSIPNHLVWLTWFYLMFHSFLNLVGELLHFADRNFYCDWWNADNIDTFWRTWNMPVHRWAVRHLYIPLVEQGYGKTFASTSVFFLSAFFHEYLVSVPLRTFKIWAFMGMMAQIPLSLVSRFVQNKLGAKWGNVIVWTSLILGQPLCIMMYYHDYVITHFGEALIDSYAEV